MLYSSDLQILRICEYLVHQTEFSQNPVTVIIAYKNKTNPFKTWTFIQKLKYLGTFVTNKIVFVVIYTENKSSTHYVQTCGGKQRKL
jgi:hypothetical protein